MQGNRVLWIFVGCIATIALGIATGWAVTQGVLIKSLLVGVVALLALFVLAQTRSIKIFGLQRLLLYLTIVAGFIGPAFLAIPIGPIHLFPYRILLPLLWVIFLMGVSIQGRVNISRIKVRPYLQFLGFGYCMLFYPPPGRSPKSMRFDRSSPSLWVSLLSSLRSTTSALSKTSSDFLPCGC